MSRPLSWSRPSAASTLVATATMALVLAHQRHSTGVGGQLSYLAAILLGAFLAWYGVSRRPREERGPWRLVALGVSTSALGDVTWGYFELFGAGGPDASVADAFWLLSYLFLFAGLLSLLFRRQDGARLDVEGLLDMAAVAVVALMVMWHYVVADLLADTSVTPLVRTLWSAYPVLDAVFLALVARLVASRATRSRVGLLLAAGAACWLSADLWYLVNGGDQAATSWADAGWMVGSVVLGASTAQHRRPTPVQPLATDTAEQLTRGRVILGVSPLIAPWLLELDGHRNAVHINPFAMFLGTLALVVLAYVRITRLIAGDRANRERLRASDTRYRALVANSSDASLLIDANGIVIEDSPSLSALIGRPGLTGLGVDAIDVVAEIDRPTARTVLDRAMRHPGATMETELRVDGSDGRRRWLQVRAVNLLHDPDVGGVVINLHDITQRKLVEAQLSHQALHDSLTGLANRTLFHDRVEHAIERNHRAGAGAALLHLDLDDFKTVNDSLGHEAGDELLCAIANRLRAAVRPADTVARLGGDEFAILLDQTDQTVDDAVATAGRLLEGISAPLELAGQQLTVTASLGIASQQEGSSASKLLREADAAMYGAKTSGPGRWAVYDPIMSEDAMDRLRLASDLPQVIDRNGLLLEYQAVTDLQSDCITGFEALVRWDHPTRGLLHPGSFIPLAESSGAIVPIGRWVLQQSCRTLARWQVNFARPDLTMAVNVSARQLTSPDLVADVAEALARSGVAPRSLVLEMTETAIVEDPAAAAERLRELRALGVRLAVDDFGTGYSSLSYLRQFPLDILKIDRSFVDGITDDATVPPILRGLIDLGHTLELEIIAEGVETAVQRDALRHERCRLAQGFLFSRPLPERDAETLLRRATQAQDTNSSV